ncbi:unnamed protein product [Fusarium graminearum]|nr:hypothetical protein HG531_005562 [Fusarium graminearum]CAF3486757.1 unnamed protein product [Fusarium graminearum]CAG1987222.1 unnamed protein product [Fusarium graminearum]
MYNEEAILRMRSSKQGLAITNGAENNRCLAITTINIDFLIIGSQHLNLPILDGSSVNKDTASIIVGGNLRSHLLLKSVLWHTQSHGPSSPFTLVLKTLESTTSTGPREESQLSSPDDFHWLITNLKFAPLGSVVATCTESQVGAASTDVVADTTVPLTIQSLAVTKIAAAGEDKKSTCRLPGFLEDNGLGDGDDSIV